MVCSTNAGDMQRRGFLIRNLLPDNSRSTGRYSSDTLARLIRAVNELVNVAATYKVLTGRYLQTWAELGELYAGIKYAIKRRRPHAASSDEKFGNDFVEGKTISPEKGDDQVLVKRSSNFSKLIFGKYFSGLGL